MRLLVIHAHPVPESFNAALCRVAVTAAREAGHEVRLIDLYAEGFNPVMSAQERRGLDSAAPPPADVAPHVEALQWAEGLIFIYPTWWYSQPAMLKGWMDRVWRPGIAFAALGPGQPIRPLLTGIRLIGVISTLGAPWWLWALVMGAPGRKVMLRGLRVCTGPGTRTFWMGLHDMDTQTQASRQRYLDRVAAQMRRLAR